jgi:hypothetical protein
MISLLSFFLILLVSVDLRFRGAKRTLSRHRRISGCDPKLLFAVMAS